jgi:hypothetical protein
MYSQNAQGVLTKTPFEVNTWTQEEAAVQMNGVSSIYSIVDESDVVVEYGYQEATTYNEEDWLTVALPKEIATFKVKQYDGLRNAWYEVSFEFVLAEYQTIEGYNIWTVPEKYEIMSGSTYRFVIE